MNREKNVDRVFLITVLILVFFGFTMFISASMSILAKNSSQFTSVTFNQATVGLLLGLLICFLFSKINYKIFRKFSFYILLSSIILTSLVFIPKLGLTLNGSTRWLTFAGKTIQPIEILNLAFVIYWAAWLSFAKEKVKTLKYGVIPLIILIITLGIPLVLQPDIDSVFFLSIIGMIMLLSAGGRIKHLLMMGFFGIVCVLLIALAKPYVKERILSFLDPSKDPLTSGYQVQQSLIAIGSGKIFGRGLGQGIQKFKFLPESIGDSIFAVTGEELGFVGCVSIIVAFVFFVFRAFRIAIRSPDTFGGLLVVGIVILIISRSFMNIASMLGVMPITGVPLAFFSQGGTAMLITLAGIGIILNVSRFGKTQ